MANTPEAISYIKLDDGLDPHPIDAMTVGNKSAEQIGELVTSIDSNSTDIQYPSAKCIYEIIYGPTGGGEVINNNYIKLSNNVYKGPLPPTTNMDYQHYLIRELGSTYSEDDLINNPPILYGTNDVEILVEYVEKNTGTLELMFHTQSSIIYTQGANYWYIIDQHSGGSPK